MVEYSIILALISIAAITAILLIGPKILQLFTNANSALP
ncbi:MULTISPECIES: Flp family type IVb pilin [Aminobacterium]|jgi:Flp pilus assembly pilin Flp|nr:Flp family type IVb pilin [Aminobacterium sp. UBA4987]